MRRPRSVLAAALLAVMATAGPARAQETELVPSPALACLSPAAAERGTPEYPAEALTRKDGGTVRVELRFDAPDAAPTLRLLNEEVVFQALLDAVKLHVQKLRVPCMTPGRPVTLRQNYVFRPGDGRRVVSEPPTDPSELVRQQLLACMAHVERVKAPAYPLAARRSGLEGKVFVRLRFTRADAPPEFERLAPARNNVLVSAVAEHVEGLRLPCLQDEPITVQQLYVFKLDGGARTLLAPLTLRQLLGGAEHVPRPFAADLGTMGCPFDLSLRYYQPYAPNTVRELESANPARRPLLDWLAGIRLKLPAATQEALVGDLTTLSIPCGTVNL